MTDRSKYRIIPNEPPAKPIPQIHSLPLEGWEKKEIKGLTGGAKFVLGLVAYFVALGVATSHRSTTSSDILMSLVAAVLVVTVITLLVRGVRISAKERLKANEARKHVEYANRSAISSAENEARTLTDQLTRTYESSSPLPGKLQEHLNSARGWIVHAEQEFMENAFGPFWDAVENATRHLAVFDETVKQAARLSEEYYRCLNGRTHTFPSFPLNERNLPNPSSVVGELRKIVRKGQTNFQFANIWEHRRTREVMIVGFRTLGDAVNNLGSTVENSFFGLQQSISSDMAKLVQEEIRTRGALDKRLREQNRMLDNIQHHRKPGITDSPSRY